MVQTQTATASAPSTNPKPVLSWAERAKKALPPPAKQPPRNPLPQGTPAHPPSTAAATPNSSTSPSSSIVLSNTTGPSSPELDHRTFDNDSGPKPPLHTPKPQQTSASKSKTPQSLATQALDIVAAETQSGRTSMVNAWSARSTQAQPINGKVKERPKEEYPALGSAASHHSLAAAAAVTPVPSTSNKSWVNGTGKSAKGVSNPSTNTASTPAPPPQRNTKVPQPHSSPPPPRAPQPARPIVNSQSFSSIPDDNTWPAVGEVNGNGTEQQHLPSSTSAPALLRGGSSVSSSGDHETRSSSSSVTRKTNEKTHKAKWVPIPAEEMQAAVDAALVVRQQETRVGQQMLQQQQQQQQQRRNPSRTQSYASSRIQSRSGSVHNSPIHHLAALPPTNVNGYSTNNPSTTTNSSSNVASPRSSAHATASPRNGLGRPSPAHLVNGNGNGNGGEYAGESQRNGHHQPQRQYAPANVTTYYPIPQQQHNMHSHSTSMSMSSYSPSYHNNTHSQSQSQQSHSHSQFHSQASSQFHSQTSSQYHSQTNSHAPSPAPSLHFIGGGGGDNGRPYQPPAPYATDIAGSFGVGVIPPRHQGHSRGESYSSQVSSSSQSSQHVPMNPYMQPYPPHPHPYTQPYWYGEQRQQQQQQSNNEFLPQHLQALTSQPPHAPLHSFEVVVQPRHQEQRDERENPPLRASFSSSSIPLSRPPPPKESAPVAGVVPTVPPSVVNGGLGSSVVFGSLDRLGEVLVDTILPTDEEVSTTTKTRRTSSFCIGGEPPLVRSKQHEIVPPPVGESHWVFGTVNDSDAENKKHGEAERSPTAPPPTNSNLHLNLPTPMNPMRLDLQKLSPGPSSATLSPLVGYLPPNIALLGGGAGTPPTINGRASGVVSPFSQDRSTSITGSSVPSPSVLMQTGDLAPVPPMFAGNSLQQQPQLNQMYQQTMNMSPYGNYPQSSLPPPILPAQPPRLGDTASEWEVKDFGYGFGHHGNNRGRDREREPQQYGSVGSGSGSGGPRSRRESGASSAAAYSNNNPPLGIPAGGGGGRRGRGGRGGPRNYAPRGGAITGNTGYHNSAYESPSFDQYYQPAPPQGQGLNQTTYYDTYQIPGVVGALPPLPPLAISQQQQPLGAVPHVAPPVPTPRSTLSFPLDATRWYLLGQLEYYFSPENMAQDFYLRQQMDSRGWISISLISTFRRIRSLTKDARVVREVLLLSTMVQVYAAGDEQEELGWVRMGGWEQFALRNAVESRVPEYVGYATPPHQQQQQPFGPQHYGVDYGVAGSGQGYEGGYEQPREHQREHVDESNVVNPHKNENATGASEDAPREGVDGDNDPETEAEEEEEDDVVFIMSRETSVGAFGT